MKELTMEQLTVVNGGSDDIAGCKAAYWGDEWRKSWRWFYKGNRICCWFGRSLSCLGG